MERIRHGGGSLVGQIELVQISGSKLEVAGWIETPANSDHEVLSLLHYDLELSQIVLRTGTGLANRTAHAGYQRQGFSFQIPVPVGLDDLQSIAIRARDRAGRIAPNLQTRSAGSLPLFLGLNELTDVDLRNWELPSRRSPPRGRQRILFNADFVEGAVQGLALDLDDQDRVFTLEAMLGPLPLARVSAKYPAEFATTNRKIKINRGFLLEIPEDRTANLTDLWFGLAEVEPTQSAQHVAAQTVRINTFRRSETAPDEDCQLTPSLIVTVPGPAELLVGFLTSAYQAVSSTGGEIIVVDASADSGVAAICDRPPPGLKVRRIEGHPRLSLGEAANMGANAATGDVLIFCTPAIRFEDEILHRLLAEFSLDDVGAASVKILAMPDTSRTTRVLYHLGVHFRPAANSSGLEPQITANEPSFSAAAGSPVCVPAVTGDFLACRSDVFKMVGAFNEKVPNEMTAPEFCLRVRKSLREVVSFNDLTVLRAADPDPIGSTASGRPFALARLVRRELLDRPGFWTGRPPNISIVLRDETAPMPEDRNFAEGLAAALKRVIPACVTVRASSDGYDLPDVDALIVLDSEYDIARVRGVGPLFTAIALARSADQWRSCPWAKSYHGMFTDSERTALELKESLSRRIDVIADGFMSGKHDQDKHRTNSAFPESSWTAGLGDDSESLTAANRDNHSEGFDARARSFISCYRPLHDEVFRFTIMIDGLSDDPHSTPARAARALARAFGALGHTARIDDQSQPPPDLSLADDCVITLRGRRAHRPIGGASDLLWIMDSPDLVSAAELEQYDHVFLASAVDNNPLAKLCTAPISPLLLGIDEPPAQFAKPLASSKSILLLIGDAGDYEGEGLDHALASGLRVLLFGRGWRDALPRRLIEGDRAAIASGDRAPYNQAEFVYIPHRKSLRRFGIIAQATFESAAAGARIVMEQIPGVEETIGATLIRTFDGKSSFAAAIESWRAENLEEIAQRERGARAIALHHSFLERARVIVDVVRRLKSWRLSNH
jgi:hypothetical protein